MLMWIMNQNLTQLSYCEKVMAVPLDERHPELPTIIRNENYDALAVYHNPENVEFVMNALVNHLQNQSMLTHGKSRVFSDEEIRQHAVFIMPKEDMPVHVAEEEEDTREYPATAEGHSPAVEPPIDITDPATIPPFVTGYVKNDDELVHNVTEEVKKELNKEHSRRGERHEPR